MKICCDGNFFEAEEPVLLASNPCFKWGAGIFETMRIYNGKLLWFSYHLERLFAGLQLIQLSANKLSEKRLVNDILKLCTSNHCLNSGRVRLTVFFNETNRASYIIEAVPYDVLQDAWTESGKKIVFYPYAQKSMDTFSNLKSCNYLPYWLAQKYAAENGADEAILLNTDNNICDGSKTNIFIIHNNKIFTPALSQGCINGVMRRVIMEEITKMGLPLYEQALNEDALLRADEVFLTNALQGVKWVQQYKHIVYSNKLTKEIYKVVQSTIQ